ncbi:zinc-binding dehydrogenase [Streptacidiphilus monticola]
MGRRHGDRHGQQRREAAAGRGGGAHHVVDYKAQDAAVTVRALAPDGVDLVVEVAVAANTALDLAVLANGGTVAFYADDAGAELTVPVRESMARNLRWLGVLVYTMPEQAKDDAVAALTDALADGAYRGGEEAGLPWHTYPSPRPPPRTTRSPAERWGRC